MSTYVLDTSVVIKWFNQKNELHTKQSRKIFNDLQSGKINILIPNLLLVELLNVLMIGKKTPIAETNLALDKLFELPLNIIDVNLSLLKIAAELMQQYNMTSYDAYFLALAKYEDCKLISDDIKAHGIIGDGSVILLEDYAN
ncbi:MAG: type II toxin-antitoxin system VapC family toxin [Candidatus Daviesbacteria bacterium]|nr:type II toxin-antitoxin system VapC family toxin [Candidatus Daviesbacteria bacterium]